MPTPRSVWVPRPCVFCKGVPLRLKPTDWESVFRSTKEEFCRPRPVRPLLQRRTKIHNRTSCRLRVMACRARGSGRQRATPTPSERGFSSRAITRTAITYSLHVMVGFTNFRVLVIQSAFESIHTSRLVVTYPWLSQARTRGPPLQRPPSPGVPSETHVLRRQSHSSESQARNVPLAGI
jgi:hypothetical protein